MALRTISITPALEDYLFQVGVAESDVMRRLRLETAAMPNARMQIGPDQARFMRWLVELISAKRCLEIGVFTGYSALSVALGIPEGGELFACDNDPEVTQIAQRYWQLAGVAHKIHLASGQAMTTIHRLIAEGNLGAFDFAFIDADKEAYDDYYEACLILLRPGGVLLVDNTLWGGRVVNPRLGDADTSAIVALNQKIAQDGRVSAGLLPIGDGLTLVRKKW